MSVVPRQEADKHASVAVWQRTIPPVISAHDATPAMRPARGPRLSKITLLGSAYPLEASQTECSCLFEPRTIFFAISNGHLLSLAGPPGYRLVPAQAQKPGRDLRA